MAAANQNLFDWDDVDALPELRRLELVLDYLPDEPIIQELEARRGAGRNDYPVRPMWRALLASFVFQHVSIESLLRELRRNPALLRLCGFNPLPLQGKPKADVACDAETGQAKVVWLPGQRREAVPGKWNFSRFVRQVEELEQREGAISAFIPRLVEQLMEQLPEFGRSLGYDGKAIDSHSTGRVDAQRGTYSDPDADWGKHLTRWIERQSGKLREKTKVWFGYRLHLIAETHYEIPVAFRVTPASKGEAPELKALLKGLGEQTPALTERCQMFSADRGLDDGELKATLWDDYAIRPLIDTRELWRAEKQQRDYDPDQPITRALNPDRTDNIVHTEKGEVRCVCPHSGEHRPMAFQGFEASRNTLKYRCPAAAYGLTCAGRETCERNAAGSPGEYGRIVRINLREHDRRIFTPTPHGSPSWQRGYNRRSALERINSRLDNSFGFERHFIRGQVKMTTRVGLALAIMMALALGHASEGRQQQMRSLVKPIPAAASG